jgi:putative SOS response-associated peptidase YedK
MCGRYTFTFTFTAESLEAAFGMVPLGFSLKSGYNIAPGQYIIIPASGFYQWKGQGQAKQPFYIHPVAGDLFAFAGMMEDWQGPNGEVMVSAFRQAHAANR